MRLELIAQCGIAMVAGREAIEPRGRIRRRERRIDDLDRIQRLVAGVNEQFRMILARRDPALVNVVGIADETRGQGDVPGPVGAQAAMP